MVAPREATLINIGMREWLLLGVQAFDKGINNTSTHTHRRETAIVVQILHRNLARKVRDINSTLSTPLSLSARCRPLADRADRKPRRRRHLLRRKP